MKTKPLQYYCSYQAIKKLIYFNLLFSCIYTSYAQSVTFQYDNAGNQIKRKYEISGQSDNNNYRMAQDPVAFEKFHPEDDFTYHPNPVQDYLHLKWQPINRHITSMQVYDSNGKQLQSHSYKETDNETQINLEGYARGIYFLHINYSTQEQASVKIIKN